MRKFFAVALVFYLIISATGASSAQSAARKSAVEAAAGAAGASAPSSATNNELVALLPASDIIAVVDGKRAFNELLPNLSGFTIAGVDKLAKSIQDFTQKTGLDPSKIESAVLSVDMEDSQGIPVAVIQGIDLNPQQIEAAMKEFGSEFKTSDYKGKTIYNIVAKVKPPSAGAFSLKTDDVALAPLGRQRVALGDLKAVRQVIDVQSGAAKGGVSATMAGALKETRASALVRFALNIPEKLRADAANQGDLFKSVAAIKIILGTFDVGSDLSLSLDSIIRTASQNDATELENGLKGLVGLGKDIFAGGGDPRTNLYAQLLERVKIGSKLNDVSLSISLSREIIEQLTKKETTPPAEKK
ncbi:MAG TPA: hypothetical protein VFS27_05340 [Blastocatellia bacterium]|nr:hypothetical protein [Blastocatellia bacterium]